MIKYGRHPAFSLIEILIVTSVITVGFMAVLGLIRKAIIVYYNNQNYLVAATIAQQGLELTRYIRDDNWLVSQPFTTNIAQRPEEGVTTIFAIDQQAMIDSDPVQPRNQGRDKIIQFYNSLEGSKLPDFTGSDFSLGTYATDSRAKIYFDEGNHNFYVANSTLTAITDTVKPTIFHNLVQTVYHNNNTLNNSEDDYLYVVSLVYWQDRGADKYFSLATYLDDYSWKY